MDLAEHRGTEFLLRRRFELLKRKEDDVPTINIDLIPIYGREKGLFNANGVVESWANYEISDYIPCTDAMTFEINVSYQHNIQVHRYDINKQCISKQKYFKVVETTGTGQFGNGTSFPLEEETAYIRVNVDVWRPEHDSKYYCKRLK
jgi:hypothetical protein